MEDLYRQPRFAFDLGLGDIWAVVKFGASGLPVLQSFNPDANPPAYADAPNDGKSPPTYGPVQNVSVQRLSTGTFLFTFGDSGGVPRLFGLGEAIWETATGIQTIDKIGTKATTRPVTSAKSFTVVTSAGGVVTDPASGDVLKIPVQFQNY